VNERTINAQIIAISANHPSRVHHPENNKPRSGTDPRYDVLFALERGVVELYDPARHGTWEIRRDENGKLTVGERGVETKAGTTDDAEREGESGQIGYAFPIERHLRDFIARNIETLPFGPGRLSLFRDDTGRDGVAYPTEVGIIDILAVDDSRNLFVFELKASRGSDAVVGQLARYMGWARQHLADGKNVRGVVVAQHVDDRLRYAASVLPDVLLFEYEISFTIRRADLGRDAA